MRKTIAVVCLAIAGVLAAAPSWTAHIDIFNRSRRLGECSRDYGRQL